MKRSAHLGICLLACHHSCLGPSRRQAISSPFTIAKSGAVQGSCGDPSRSSTFRALMNDIGGEEDGISEVSLPSRIVPNTFNLIKALAGSGLLALPGGLARISNSPKTLIHGLGLMTSLGALSAYTFQLYGRMVHETQAKSLGELWEIKKGSRYSWIISFATLAFCLGAALSYSILIGGIFPDLAETCGMTGPWTSRSVWILGVTLAVLVPLCNLNSLLRLAPLSIVGVLAVGVTTCFLAWRCPAINQSSPYSLPTGKFLTSIPLTILPSFDTYDRGLASLSSLLLLGMGASSYLGHFSAPAFYSAIRESSTSSEASLSDLRVFNSVAILGFGTTALLNCLVMSFGFLTFGGTSNNMILNNFSLLDCGATVCRLLMGIGIIGGYPFLIRAARTELLGLCKRFSMQSAVSSLGRNSTRWILPPLTIIALLIRDAGFVISASGSLAGSLIMYTFPALLFLSHTNGGEKEARGSLQLERQLCRVLVIFGIMMSLMGGVASTVSTFYPRYL